MATLLLEILMAIWLIGILPFAYMDWRDSQGRVHFEPHSIWLALLIGAFWPVQILACAVLWLSLRREP